MVQEEISFLPRNGIEISDSVSYTGFEVEVKKYNPQDMS
jgi:hypothetical protein